MKQTVEEAAKEYAENLYKEYSGKGTPDADVFVIQKKRDSSYDFEAGATWGLKQGTESIIDFNLSEIDLNKLLGQCLKPEEINGDPKTQAERIKELIRWFNRYADGNANPKWFHRHAFELVYYIATTNNTYGKE